MQHLLLACSPGALGVEVSSPTLDVTPKRGYSSRYVVIWSTHGAAHTWGCSSFLEAIKGGAYLFAL